MLKIFLNGIWVSFTKNTPPSPHRIRYLDDAMVYGQRRTSQRRRCLGIIELAARESNVSLTDLLSSGRNQKLVAARHKAAWLLRKSTPLSLLEIGLLLNRDHSTILNAIEKFEKHCLQNSAIELYANQLLAEAKRIFLSAP